MRNLLSFLFFLLFLGDVVSAQNSGSGMDLRLLENIRKEIELSSDQDSTLQTLIQNAAEEIQKLENDKLKVQREIEDEEILLTRIKVINQQIKDVREMRDLEIQSNLTTDQLSIYESKIKPSKPQILHFGMHNRADCKVCKQ